MFSGLLSFLGLGASVICGPDLVDERNQHLDNLVKRVQEVSAGHTDEKIHYPFVIQSKRQTLPDSWPSPIYSRYRVGVCEVILNDNTQTHQGYETLMERVKNEKPQLLESAQYYIIGHEIGHCVYKHLRNTDPQKVADVFHRDEALEKDRTDGLFSSPSEAPPSEVKVQQRRLHEEIFSDLYGIEFSKKWLGQKAAGLDDIVVRFREKVSDKDPNYFTHHYIKSCLEEEPKVMDRLQTEHNPVNR